MTTLSNRARDRGPGGLTVHAGPPQPSSPLPIQRETAPPPSIDDLRTVDGWSPHLLPPRPLHLLQQYRKVELQSLYDWHTGLELRSSNGQLTENLQPKRNPRFDPRSMLWWSQWEIVFSKRALGLSDDDTCSLYKYRWKAMDKSTEYMQPYHVAQVMEILSDGHPWHAHAFRPGDPRPEVEICNEFLRDLGSAQEVERANMESEYAERRARESVRKPF